MKVSVVINNYNYARFLSDAIDSALNQTHRPFEVIVVDDGSTDHSRDVILSYGERIIPILGPNDGQIAAYNRGVEAATGELICFLDADDRFMPDKLERIVALFRGPLSKKENVMLSHPMPMIDSDGKRLPGWKPTIFNHKGKRRPIPRQLTLIGNSKSTLAFVKKHGFFPFICGGSSSISLSRSLARRIFPLTTTCKLNYADSWVADAALIFGELYFTPESLSEYRAHGSNLYWKNPAILPPIFFQEKDRFLNEKLASLGFPPLFSFFESRISQSYYIRARDWNGMWRLARVVLARSINFSSLRFAFFTLFKIIYFSCRPLKSA